MDRVRQFRYALVLTRRQERVAHRLVDVVANSLVNDMVDSWHPDGRLNARCTKHRTTIFCDDGRQDRAS